MKKSSLRSTIGIVLGTAMIGSLSLSTNAVADTSPFTMKNLSSGYTVAGGGMEGKCGARKCGDKKAKAAKSSEGKCGAKKGGHGKHGGHKGHMSKTPAQRNCTNYDEDMCG